MDPSDAAAAAAAQPPPVRMSRFEVTIASTQRSAAIELPADATDAELAHPRILVPR